MTYGVIYKATNKVNGKVYIGQTVDFERRKYSHFHRNDGTPFHNDIQLHGKENFEWEVVDVAMTKDELNEKEKKYIVAFDSKNSGYNLTDGGDTSPFSEKKIIERRSHNEAWRTNKREAMRRLARDAEWLSNVREANKRVCSSKEWLEKNRQVHATESWKKNQKEGLRRTIAKKCQCVETGEVFLCKSDVSKMLGKNRNAINNAIRQGTICGGFHWINYE